MCCVTACASTAARCTELAGKMIAMSRQARCQVECQPSAAQGSCSSMMKRLASLSERSLCARPEQVLIACSWPGVTLDVKNTCAVRYCGFVFQSFSSSCTLLSEGVMKYTPETESKGSLFFSKFSTTAAHWLQLLCTPCAIIADVTECVVVGQSEGVR